MDASAAAGYYDLEMAKQQKSNRKPGASFNAVARAMAHIGKVGRPHRNRRKEGDRAACRGSWRVHT